MTDSPKKVTRRKKRQVYPPLTGADLPYARQPLTEARLAELFAFCAAEYQKRHGRAWRFEGGRIVHSTSRWILGKGYYIIIPPPSEDKISLSAHVGIGATRAQLAFFLLHVVNDAYDLKLTLK